MATWVDARAPTLLEGLSVRSQLIECPLHAYTVTVSKCSGGGECAAICPVGVFGVDGLGRCVVVNKELCFGCLACVAQCAEGGVKVEERPAGTYPGIEDVLR